MLSTRAERIHALATRLSHPDPAQLFFQVAEIAGDLTYLQHRVTVREGDVVLDIGANFGVAAVFFATQCGAGLVHSFEPVPANFALLQTNVADLSACITHPEGLSDTPRRAEITFYPEAAAMSGLYADPDRDGSMARAVLGNHGLSSAEAGARLAHSFEPQTLTCDLTTLSAVLQRERLSHVDLLKIDVERAELDVLAGLDDRDWPRIRQVAIEVHDEAGRLDQIAGLLRGHGFRVTPDQDQAMRGTSVRMLYATRG